MPSEHTSAQKAAHHAAYLAVLASYKIKLTKSKSKSKSKSRDVVLASIVEHNVLKRTSRTISKVRRGKKGLFITVEKTETPADVDDVKVEVPVAEPVVDEAYESWLRKCFEDFPIENYAACQAQPGGWTPAQRRAYDAVIAQNVADYKVYQEEQAREHADRLARNLADDIVVGDSADFEH